ncbi:hypothetical protein IQ266_00595 [filamentous cyanobacterium LEGE 11480]|uniref:Uncharacterized protein n=1 Tax=Romeriopsis navalis LEGE 11480 TaxID=2777977 RepID=A0A928VKW5_9CYAN|nr:hypothetical protein [Romeriopsis navalis]MBE9028252.1 hypothetical protein [Romeriopsis navalis LEGE 11480]
MKRANRYAVIAVTPLALQLLATVPADAQLSNRSRLALDGIGAVRVGMTIAEAERATGLKFFEPSRFRASEGCYYIQPRTQSPNISFMVFSGSSSKTMNRSSDRIVRVDIDRGSPITTLSGIAIGATEAQVKRRYPGKIKASLHPYTGSNGGKYLTYKPSHLADQRYSLIFETLNGKVVRYRSGFADAVAQIEGCA